MGSARMGNDPKVSCTDAYGWEHGMENLYVAGSSLFPAVGLPTPHLPSSRCRCDWRLTAWGICRTPLGTECQPDVF